MDMKKDGGWYCWLVIAAVFTSMMIMSISTYGSISVLVYIWAEKFNITTEVAAWAPGVMNGSRFLLGNEMIVCFCECFPLALPKEVDVLIKFDGVFTKISACFKCFMHTYAYT